MRLLLILLSFMLMLTGCADHSAFAEPARYEASFLTLFDTVTTIIGYAESEADFRITAQSIHDDLLEYHQLFDIYHDYPEISNLKTVNDNAGGAAVSVDRRIIDLLLFCKDAYTVTDGLVNIAMGSVLSLWHTAREGNTLPDSSALQQAALHTDPSLIEIDTENCTVRLADAEMSLDVGAVAKGYAAQKAAEAAPEGLLISVGGNVIATGPHSASPWSVGIRSPYEDDGLLHTLSLSSGSVVTSGDYQRYYTVDNRRYHHIIHPDSLMPHDLWRSVTVVCTDSAIADVLSTALFLTSLEHGKTILDAYAAEAVWADAQGNLFYSDNYTQYMKT